MSDNGNKETFETFNIAVRTRDVIEKIAARTVRKLMPPPRFAEVTALDFVNKRVTVEYPDESGTTFTIPCPTVMPIYVGQTVRVNGAIGARYVDQVPSGQLAVAELRTIGSAQIDGDLDVDGINGIATKKLRTNDGDSLVITAGESNGYATGSNVTGEYVYLAGEGGVKVASSPDNWSSGWAGRNEATLVDQNGDTLLPGNLTLDAQGALLDFGVASGTSRSGPFGMRVFQGGSAARSALFYRTGTQEWSIEQDGNETASMRILSDGDAQLVIQADADNATESHNPRLVLAQDGADETSTNLAFHIGLREDGNDPYLEAANTPVGVDLDSGADVGKHYAIEAFESTNTGTGAVTGSSGSPNYTTGFTISGINVRRAGAWALVIVTADISCTSTGVFVGVMDNDGSQDSEEMIWNTETGRRLTIEKTWYLPLSVGTGKTIRFGMYPASGGFTKNATHSVIKAIVFQ